MERKLNDFFASQTMPVDCAGRIEASLDASTFPSRPGIMPMRRILTTAAIVALLCICTLSVYAISCGKSSKPLPHEGARQPVRNAYELLFGLETRSKEERVADAARQREIEQFQRWALNTMEPYAEARGDRLYFIACCEDIDITDQSSADHVYLYTYTDERGYVHYIGVGGTAEAWGAAEVIYHPNFTHLFNGWADGHGGGYLYDESGEDLGWKVEFKKLTGHPYP